MVRVLLAVGADVNQPGNYDWTPLMAAANAGCLEVVEIFLEAGAEVDVRIEKESAITLAADAGYPEVVEVLSALARKKDAAKARKILARREKEESGPFPDRDVKWSCSKLI